MRKTEREILSNVVRRLRGENADQKIVDAFTGPCKNYLETWVIPALEIMAREGAREMGLALSLSSLPYKAPELAMVQWTVDDVFTDSVDADEVFQIRKEGIKAWAEKVFDTVDGSWVGGKHDTVIRCPAVGEIQKHGAWLLSQVKQEDPILLLREDVSGQGFLWLDDGVLAIAMHGMVNDGLAESDMRLYADGQWTVRDVRGVDILPSEDVQELPVIAEFWEDSFSLRGTAGPGAAGRKYIGIDEEA